MSNRPTSLPLQSKVSLTLAVLIGLFIAASYVIVRQVISPAFDELEMSAARSDLKRAEMALRTDLENLEAITADWAPWDDIHAYALGRNPGFRRSNLDRPTLENLGLDFMAVYGSGGRLLWGKSLYDGDEYAVEDLGLLSPGDPAAPHLTSHDDPAARTAGFAATRFGPALVSSRPILKSDDSGPVAGALVMGQFIDDARLARLRDRTDVDMRWAFAETSGGSRQPDGGGARFEVGATRVSGSKVLPDILGRSFLVLRSETPKRISSLGNRTVKAALVFLAVAGLLVSALVWVMLRLMILRPIEGLATHMATIRKTGDLSRRLEEQRDDEIGDLARQFDALAGEVNDARQALLDQSFKAGKADTAAEVLHNIRNAMTPMINSLERVGKALKVTERLRVAEATAEIADPECAGERKQKLLQYIDASFKHVAGVGADASEDLQIATAQARQVEGILADQEKFANVEPISEVLKLNELLGEAVHVIPRDAQPEIDVDIPAVSSSYAIRAHRIGLLQVLGNLILNAYESIQRCKVNSGRIRFDVVEETIEKQAMVRLTISDNGTGFNANTGERIFQRGFTSKHEGETTGLGLHWCANAIRGMGGSITAESRGLGQGAVFHVLLPAAQGG